MTVLVLKWKAAPPPPSEYPDHLIACEDTVGERSATSKTEVSPATTGFCAVVVEGTSRQSGRKPNKRSPATSGFCAVVIEGTTRQNGTARKPTIKKVSPATTGFCAVVVEGTVGEPSGSTEVSPTTTGSCLIACEGTVGDHSGSSGVSPASEVNPTTTGSCLIACEGTSLVNVSAPSTKVSPAASCHSALIAC